MKTKLITEPVLLNRKQLLQENQILMLTELNALRFTEGKMNNNLLLTQ